MSHLEEWAVCLVKFPFQLTKSAQIVSSRSLPVSPIDDN